MLFKEELLFRDGIRPIKSLTQSLCLFHNSQVLRRLSLLEYFPTSPIDSYPFLPWIAKLFEYQLVNHALCRNVHEQHLLVSAIKKSAFWSQFPASRGEWPEIGQKFIFNQISHQYGLNSTLSLCHKTSDKRLWPETYIWYQKYHSISGKGLWPETQICHFFHFDIPALPCLALHCPAWHLPLAITSNHFSGLGLISLSNLMSGPKGWYRKSWPWQKLFRQLVIKRPPTYNCYSCSVSVAP